VIAALLPTGTTPLLVAAIAAGTASLWLLLPQASGAGGRTGSLGGFFGGRTGLVGIVLGLAALAGLALAGRRLGGLGEEAAFQLVALVAIVGGAATVVTRSPVYSAIWFALALAGVAGVLLVLGASSASCSPNRPAWPPPTGCRMNHCWRRSPAACCSPC
jgi:uncharacterized membrane protein YhaH (DUF805 family)